MAEHVDPVADDELLYRRILASGTDLFDRHRDARPSPKAFHPTSHDLSGLSLSRAQSTTHPEFLTAVQCAARGRNPSGYYIAMLRAGELRAAGIQIVESPEDGDPGHVELPDMNFANRKSNQVKTWEEIMAQRLTLQVVGPFPSGVNPQCIE